MNLLESARDHYLSRHEEFSRNLRDEPGWRSLELPCHHMVNVSMPEEVANILIEAA